MKACSLRNGEETTLSYSLISNQQFEKVPSSFLPFTMENQTKYFAIRNPATIHHL
ncbi:hypothetical protein GBA52_028655 [Prunus armeniaca]|nr:hypothetical protein GBA52_028655 [Prunus armeniaca]